MIYARCPTCAEVARVPRRYGGRKIRCPGCNEAYLVVRLLPFQTCTDLDFATDDSEPPRATLENPETQQ